MLLLVQLIPLETGRIVGLREAEWTRCFNVGLSADHNYTRSPIARWPHNTYARQDHRIVRTIPRDRMVSSVANVALAIVYLQ